MAAKTKSSAPTRAAAPRPRPEKNGNTNSNKALMAPTKDEDIAKRRSSEQMGDIEFRYDLDPQLSWNPLARLGFDPENTHVTGVDKDTKYIAERYSERNPQGSLNKYMEKIGKPNLVDKVKPGDILVSSTVANPPIYAHEYTHSGFDKVVSYYKEDPEAFKKAYGEDASSMIERVANSKDYNEAATELMDDINTTMSGVFSNMEKAQTELGGGYSLMLADKLSKKLKKERASEMDKLSTTGTDYAGIQGILIAAEDLLKAKGEPPLAKHIPPSFFQRTLKKLGFAEGGSVVPEEEQMNDLFKSERIDPVSGNDVPPGALPQEVRDDVDAKLSEGEYVVPADVLRYYGVKFFEDLRNKAKKSLQAMDEDGRIGGEPLEEEMDDLPFSDEELVSEDDAEGEVMEAARGALVGYQEGGMQLSYPSYIKQPDLTSLGLTNPSGTASAGGVEYRKYVNDAGMTITIPYFNGQPMGIVPVGYYSEGSAPTQETKETANIVTEDKGGKRDKEPDYEGIDYKSLSDEDLQKSFDQTKSDVVKGITGVTSLAAAPVGIVAAALNAVSASQAANEIERRTGKRPETTGLMSKVADFLTGADKIGSMSDVVGKDDSGNDLVSAVKGFDSGMGAVAAPLGRPDRGGTNNSGSSTDKEDDEKDNGGFREGPMGKNE